jgi:hypothetical protein
VSENEELQKAAGEAEAIPKLAEIINRRNQFPISDTLFEVGIDDIRVVAINANVIFRYL